MKHSIILVLALMLLDGCSPKEPPMKIYRLAPPTHIQKVSSPFVEYTLKVAYPTSIKDKATTNIYYSYSDLEEGSYLNASWASNSSQLIMMNVVRSLEQARVFRSVLDFNSMAVTDYFLESEIYDMYHKVRDGLSVSVFVVRFDLIDASTNRLIKSRKFTYEIPTQSIDALGYVQATNQAMEKLNHDLIAWIVK